jgi:murein DD-endopeptidase MepM/ murein hydrolase activator NlpD
MRRTLLLRTLWLPMVLCVAGLGCGDEPEDVGPVAEATPEPTPEPTPPPPPWTVHEVTVRSGDTITKILQEQGLTYAEALALVGAAADIHDLAKIRAGNTFEVRKLKDDEAFAGLVYPLDRFGERRLIVERGASGFVAQEAALATESVPVVVRGLVTSSLWGACEQVGLAADNIAEMAGIFEWQMDFNTMVRQGDAFRALIEEVRHPDTGKRLRYGKILAAEYRTRGKTLQGFRFEDSEGRIGYFDADGMSAKRMFLKSPLKFSRISSGFSRRRYHPVLKKWRAHNGIDYAAGRGTPVRAIGAGVVTFSGTKGGYGKHVRVKHSKTYGSSYSHLNKRSVSNGQRVEQGQIIGTVGSTGLATGPHLHFEFYVNGKYTNFLAQTFPRTDPINDAERPAFEILRDERKPLLHSVEFPAFDADAPVSEVPEAPIEVGAGYDPAAPVSSEAEGTGWDSLPADWEASESSE